MTAGDRLFFARVVGRIDVSDRPGTHPVKLKDGFSLCPREMPHRRRPVAECSGGHRLRRCLVEFIADADIERAGEDGHVLDTAVRVGRDLISIRKAQAHREQSFLGGIALEHRELRSGRQ